MRVVQSILKSFPIDEGSGMAMLLHPIAFTLHVEAALDPALEAASAGSIEGGAQGSSSRGGGHAQDVHAAVLFSLQEFVFVGQSTLSTKRRKAVLQVPLNSSSSSSSSSSSAAGTLE
jgi:hypothetical protein